MTANKVELVTIFRDVSRQAENYNMSLYEQLIQEGVEQGIEQGIDLTNRKAVKAMMKLNMNSNLIASALELTIDHINVYIEQIKNE